jgi:LPS sulfotransferase NodH
MTDCQLVAVVGQQRTGSTVLRTFIANALGCPDLGEVFHGLTELETSYWGFVLDEARREPTSILPTSWYNNWEKFIDYQSRRLRASRFVFDHKVEYFTSTLLTNQGGSWIFYRVDNVKFIFLERKNLAAQLASRLKAEATNDWVQVDECLPLEKKKIWNKRYERRSRPAAPLKPPTIRPLAKIPVDVDFFESEIKRIDELTQWGKEYLARYRPLCVAYEDLFDADGDFSIEATTMIGGFLGVDLQGAARRPFLVKQSHKSFLTFLENSEELRRRFRGSKYEWMFVS